ncbi:hypothetical protein CO657_02900 [Rhizobium acidisoli]|uniref:Uncharacterized protein n=1 Tax=Rhizobium acidisoli TaxID=1538158 RepID=A0AAE5TTJ5_9HYPH|nr:hypothetical protein CO657_02900 [Rhizobium acidisoli]
MVRVCREAPSSALRAPTGVEPLVSTRPSDPRWGEEGIERSRHHPFSPAGRRWPEGSDEGAADLCGTS